MIWSALDGYDLKSLDRSGRIFRPSSSIRQLVVKDMHGEQTASYMLIQYVLANLFASTTSMEGNLELMTQSVFDLLESVSNDLKASDTEFSKEPIALQLSVHPDFGKED